MPLTASFLRENISGLALKAKVSVDNEAKNHREVSEAFEMVASFEFYSGKYNSAVFNYEEAFFHRHFFPTDRENPILCIMAAICYYNMHNYSKAYSVFERAVEQCHLADAKDLECIAMTNMAVIEHCMQRSKVCSKQAADSLHFVHAALSLSIHDGVSAAIDKSTEALTLVDELPLTHPMQENNKYSTQHRRVYVGIMIRAGHYGQAELSIREFMFSEKETTILLAGCKFLGGQFESSKTLLEESAARIGEDGSMAPLPAKLYRHSSNMFQKTPEEADREEQCMFSALILYNLGVIYSTSRRYTEGLDLFQRAVVVLSSICSLPGEQPSQQLLADKFKSHATTKYLIFNIPRSLDAVSLDYVLGPAVLLSQCLAAKAEAAFLASDLSGATLIQAGNSLPSDKKGAASETQLLSSELSNAFNSYLDSHPNLRQSLTPEEVAGGGDKQRSASRQGDRSGLTLTTTLYPQGIAGKDSSADLLSAQEVLGPFRRLLGACGGGVAASAVATETITAMKVLKNAGRATASTASTPAAAIASAGNKKAASTAPGPGFILPKLSSADKMLEAPEESTTRGPGFEQALKTLPKCSNSVRASMLVVPENFQPRSLISSLPEVGAPRTGGSRGAKSKGQDSDHYAAAVVEWALMICEGASLGMLGVPMVAVPKDFSERRRDKERERIKAEAKGAREKLQDCLMQHKPNNPAILMSVYSTLAKLCMNLGLRTDAGSHITMFEDLASNIGQPRPIALAKKFRVDYEEWLGDATMPSTAPSQAKLKRMQGLLAHVKVYYAATKVCGDNNLHRDACKRLMNVFVDISNIPDPLGTPPRELNTTAELARFTQNQIEEFEEKDILWMKGFSRARAMFYMREMKKIGKCDVPDVEAVNDELHQDDIISAGLSNDIDISITDIAEPGDNGKQEPVEPVKAALPPGMSFESFSSSPVYDEEEASCLSDTFSTGDDSQHHY